MDFIAQLDTSVFQILTAASQNDRQSFLRLQGLTGTEFSSYGYLEVGSEAGGSILPYLLDDRCDRVVSVDLRPSSMPDERARYFDYPSDAEAIMIESLSKYATTEQMSKMTVFRRDVSDIRPEEIPTKSRLALIDAEHTNTSCFSDATAVLDLVNDDSIIAFHDANLISDAIQNFERMLQHLGRQTTTVFLPDCVAAIGLGAMAEPVRRVLGPLGFDRNEYLPRIRKQRWEAVAASVNLGLQSQN